MIRVSAVVSETSALKSSPQTREAVLDVCLPYDLRKKSRFLAQSLCNREIGFFLERGSVLKDGDTLRADSGELVRIQAALEEVSTAICGDQLLLLKAAYHLGNRHVPLQVGEARTERFGIRALRRRFWLRYQPDYVLDDMLVRMGLSVFHEKAPFHPESGAYAATATSGQSLLRVVPRHGHSHHHSHHHPDDGHDHGHHHV